MDLKPQSKSPRWIVSLTFIGLFVLFTHFLLTTVFNLREFVSPSIRVVADKYAFPAFHQDMKLFAPDLSMYSAQLESRNFENDKWSQWTDVSAQSGFDGSSRMERIEQGFVHQLSWEVTKNLYSKEGKKQFDRIERSTPYRNTLYFALRMEELQKTNDGFDSIQVRLNYRFTRPPLQKDSAAVYSILEFPVYANDKTQTGQ